MCGAANISARWCGNRSSFKTTRRSCRTRVPVGFPAYRWSAHPYGRAFLRRTCAFWLVLGRRVGGNPLGAQNVDRRGRGDALRVRGHWPEHPDRGRGSSLSPTNSFSGTQRTLASRQTIGDRGLELSSLQKGPKIRRHIGPLGQRASALAGAGGTSATVHAFLWQVVRAPHHLYIEIA